MSTYLQEKISSFKELCESRRKKSDRFIVSKMEKILEPLAESGTTQNIAGFIDQLATTITLFYANPYHLHPPTLKLQLGEGLGAIYVNLTPNSKWQVVSCDSNRYQLIISVGSGSYYNRVCLKFSLNPTTASQEFFNNTGIEQFVPPTPPSVEPISSSSSDFGSEPELAQRSDSCPSDEPADELLDELVEEPISD